MKFTTFLVFYFSYPILAFVGNGILCLAVVFALSWLILKSRSHA